MKDMLKLTVLISLLLLLSSGTAYAYLDAGTGSIIMQILLGGLAGLAVVLRLFWRHVLRFLGINKTEKEDIRSASREP